MNAVEPPLLPATLESTPELIDPYLDFEVAQEVINERVRQDAKWGLQNHPDGTGGPTREEIANRIRTRTQTEFAEGYGTWRDVLEEEVAEAFAESDPEKLLAELLQVAAVTQAWASAIKRRSIA